MVVTVVVEVYVEDGCCTPWQTYWRESSAAPATPLPK
jgi:hypothetical protein